VPGVSAVLLMAVERLPPPPDLLSRSALAVVACARRRRRGRRRPRGRRRGRSSARPGGCGAAALQGRTLRRSRWVSSLASGAGPSTASMTVLRGCMTRSTSSSLPYRRTKKRSSVGAAREARGGRPGGGPPRGCRDRVWRRGWGGRRLTASQGGVQDRVQVDVDVVDRPDVLELNVALRVRLAEPDIEAGDAHFAEGAAVGGGARANNEQVCCAPLVPRGACRSSAVSGVRASGALKRSRSRSCTSAASTQARAASSCYEYELRPGDCAQRAGAGPRPGQAAPARRGGRHQPITIPGVRCACCEPCGVRAAPGFSFWATLRPSRYPRAWPTLPAPIEPIGRSTLAPGAPGSLSSMTAC
jgi:hypothetical protein